MSLNEVQEYHAMSLNEIVRSEDKDQVIGTFGRTANRSGKRFVLLVRWARMAETQPAFQRDILAHHIGEDSLPFIAAIRLAQTTEDLLFGSLTISNEGKPLADELRLQRHNNCCAAGE
jgi:hypothetical protein